MDTLYIHNLPSDGIIEDLLTLFKLDINKGSCF